MTRLPSSRRAEMLPAVPSTRPRRNMSLAAASTAALGVVHESHRASTSGFTMWVGVPSDSSASSPSATICACRTSVFHVAPPICGVSTTLGRPVSGWSTGSHSPSKWSRPAAATLPLCSAATSASVSCSWARAVLRNTTPSRIAANCSAPIMPTVSSVTGACSETMSACLEQLVEAVAGLVVVRVVGDDRDAEPGQPPPQGPADGAEAHQARRPPGDLAAAEPLVGDGAVAKHLAGADIGVGGAARDGWPRTAARRPSRRPRRHCGPGVCRTGIPAAVAPAMSTLFGITAGGRDRPQREVEHRSTHRIGLHHKDIGAFCAGAIGQLLGGVDPQRGLVDPRVVDDIGQLAQLVETRPPQRGGHQGTRSRGHDCPCWRTVTRVSREEVTIGIDIGTTAVKAVAADEHGQVVARTRIPHRLRVPAPDKLEHDAEAGVAQRTGGGPRAAGPPRRPRGGRLGDGAVPDRRRRRRVSR